MIDDYHNQSEPFLLRCMKRHKFHEKEPKFKADLPIYESFKKSKLQWESLDEYLIKDEWQSHQTTITLDDDLERFN